MIIGITGGVGAGKSTVLGFLQNEYDAELIILDDISRNMSEPGGGCFEAVGKLFGKDIVLPDGSYDRKKIADIVFNDKKLLSELNSVIHPAVRQEVLKRIASSENRIIVIESAILFETGYDELCDEVWYIFCDENERIRRLAESRNYSEEKSRAIIKSQKDDGFFRAAADYVIDNSKDTDKTKEQIRKRMINEVW